MKESIQGYQTLNPQPVRWQIPGVPTAGHQVSVWGIVPGEEIEQGEEIVQGEKIGQGEGMLQGEEIVQDEEEVVQSAAADLREEAGEP